MAPPTTVRRMLRQRRNDLKGSGVAVSGMLRPMFGRDAELGHVLALLRSERLVTLTGRGGVGKTRLAEEVVGAWPAGTTVVGLTGLQDPDLVLPETAAALGLQGGGPELRDAVLSRLASPGHLLVLDNLEHLLDGIDGPLGELLGACPELRILTTSQAPTRLAGEQVVRLVPLAVPEPAEARPEVLLGLPSVLTYCDRVSAVDRNFRLEERNAADVAELCRRLEGLPLALELAAARHPALAPASLVRLLDRPGGDVLSDRGRNARHRDLAGTVAWTYEILEPPEQRLLRRLAVVVGTFDVDAVIELAGEVDVADSLDGLSRLIDLHLVDPVGPLGQRFSIPTSIRAVALAESEALGELADTERRHLALRARQARAVAERAEWQGSEAASWALEGDRDDLYACLERAIGAGELDDALDIGRGLAALCDRRGYDRSSEALLERLLRLAESGEADPCRHAAVLLWSAELGIRHGATTSQEELRSRIDRAETIGTSLDHAPTRFHAVVVRLLTTPFTGDLEGAEGALALGFDLARSSGDETWFVILQTWSGMLAGLLQDEETALDQGLAALGGANRLGDREAVVRAVMLLGALTDPDPHRIRTVPSHEEALALAREVGLPFYEGLLLSRIVAERSRAGDVPGALRAAREALDVSAMMPTSPTVGYHLIAVANAAHTAGDHEAVAFVHGVLEEQLPVLHLTQAPRHVERYEAMVEQCRRRLGASFDPIVRTGSGLTWDQGRALAALYLDGRIGGPTIRDRDAGAGQLDEALEAEAAGSLTERQIEVLRLMAKGLTNKDIAAELGVRPKTVMHHAAAIYRNLGVQRRGEATALAFRSGLLD